MKREPLVSSIIIFLNGELFLEEAILSALEQTYKNWELLLVDDGSTDSSTRIAKQYASHVPNKIRYLEHEGHLNHGMSAARNLGIRHAKGDYIAFLDCDDVWLPQKLEKQVSILEELPEVGMVYGSTQLWYSWTNKPEDISHDSQRLLGVQPNTIIQPPKLLALFLQNKALAPSTCGILIRRRIVEEIGGFEENFRSLYEDQAFFAKVCSKVPVFVESGCWDKYRQHPDSCCHVAEISGNYTDGKPNFAHLSYLTWLENYLFQEGITNVEIWRSLQKARWPYDHAFLYKIVSLFQSQYYLFCKRLKYLLLALIRAIFPGLLNIYYQPKN